METTTPLPVRVVLRMMAAALLLALTAPVASATPRIVQPSAEEVIHDNTGQVRVIVTGVADGLRVQPVLDGTPASAPVPPPTFELAGVTRGTHELVIHIVDAQGRIAGRTQATRFHVWQASRLFRGGEN